MNSWTNLLACPFCKLGMDEIQARAMEYSIYLLLVLVYALMGVIIYKIARMMAREERALVQPPSVATPTAARTPALEAAASDAKSR